MTVRARDALPRARDALGFPLVLESPEGERAERVLSLISGGPGKAPIDFAV